MSVDYPLAEEHLVPRSFMFNSMNPVAVVIHKTGGDATPQAVYDTFLNSGNPGKSAHYAIGQDGTIWQFVPESLGAGANGITDSTTEAFWQPYIALYGNLNTCTISIEHCDPSTRNDTPLTDTQKQASFALVAHLCRKYGIAPDHIKPHKSIVSTACPGTYPMSELISFVAQGGSSVQNYSPHAGDFNNWFTVDSNGNWVCKQTGKTIQGAILTLYEKLSIDGQSLPILGLPMTGEITWTINGKTVVLMVFERGGIYADHDNAKDNQPGISGLSICKLTDIDFLQHIPGLPTATKPDTSTVVSLLKALPTDAQKAAALAVLGA